MRYVLHENHYLITDVKRRLIGKKFILFIKNYFKIQNSFDYIQNSVRQGRPKFFLRGGGGGR